VRVKATNFRSDIVGLRALAVTLVILAHFEIPFFEFGFIGVDVFFVISGFLITRILYSDFLSSSLGDPSKSFISLGNFYLRRIRRLLPAAVAVIAGVNVISFFLLNSEARGNLLENSKWSLLFLANVAFLRSESDYFQQNSEPSMLLHFWSLSVEEQFYFVWPLLFLFAASLNKIKFREKYFRFNNRILLLILIASIASFAFLQFGFRTAPAEAYFSIFTRAWELGIGGFFGVLAFHKRRETVFSPLELYLPLVGSLAFSAVFINDGNWATYIAIPVIATGFFLYAGQGNFHSKKIKSVFPKVLTKIVMFIGTISYSLYLVHWPIFVIFDSRVNLDNLLLKLCLILLSLFTAFLLWKFVELPFQSISLPKTTLWDASVFNFFKLRRYWFGALSLTLVGSLYLLTYPSISNTFFSRDATESRAALDPNLRKYAEYQSNLLSDSQSTLDPQTQENDLSSGEIDRNLSELLKSHIAKLNSALSQNSLTPATASLLDGLKKNISPYEASPCSYQDTVVPINCSIGSSSTQPKTVALIGDSKMGHFAQPLIDYFMEKNWRIEPMIMDGCILSDPKLSDMKNCASRSQWVLEKISSENYDLVISAEWPGARDLKYKNDFFRSIQESSKYLIILQTNPKTQSPIDCITSRNTYTLDCQKIPQDLIEGWRSALSFISSMKSQNTTVIDSHEWICVDLICPYVSGDVLVTRDGSHLTYSFVKVISELLFAQLDAVGPWISS
jgi:peptidoglycan/LPS O-acetylase OafA/YrhL